MILVCGATGDLGGRVVRELVAGGQHVRALVRPTTDATALERTGVEVARGDLRQPDTLDVALQGVDTVVTTANAIGRLLAGPTDLSIDAVDRDGNANLVRAAERAGVRRFVFVSAAGGEGMAGSAPFAAAKVATEELLRSSSLPVVIVRPDMFQEIWAGRLGGFDAEAGRAQIFGRGRTRHRYVAVDDVAALTAHLALAPDPPAVVEVGGPEALSPREVLALYEDATGRSFRVVPVPRPVLKVAGRLLARVKPGLGSVMGMALHADTQEFGTSDAALREAGIEPRPVSDYVRQEVARLAPATGAGT